ncbi:hypothetical protein LSAT2_002420 [Lamellibrachia satsuma]|nr:hypothetical protein LSAT2_002420 [Lamellibrachia satsuma]
MVACGKRNSRLNPLTRLDSCDLSRQTLTPVMAGLTGGGLQLEVLNLNYNTGLLETEEAGGKLGDTLGTMTRLRGLWLMGCGLTDQSLTALSAGLTRPGGQQLQVLNCSLNPLTDASRVTFRRLLTQHPELTIRAWDCHLSPECVRQLREEFGERRFNWSRGRRDPTDIMWGSVTEGDLVAEGPPISRIVLKTVVVQIVLVVGS